jgi:hypothetical protein
MYNIYLKDGNFIIVSAEDTQPTEYTCFWEATEEQINLINNGAELSIDGQKLQLTVYPRTLEVVEIDQSSRYMTQTKFLSRLTSEEIKGIYLLAEQSIDIKIWLDKFKMAQDIWLDHPDLVQGLYALAQLGILTNERVQTILT